MKLRILLAGVLLVILFSYLGFLVYEDAIIEKLAPKFPKSEENSPGYYADLVSFLVSETVWIGILLVACTYFIFYGNLSSTIDSVEKKMMQHTSTTLALAVTIFGIICIMVATTGLEQFPNSADEFAYLFQAEQLSEGKLWNDVHGVPDFFEFHHLAQKDGKWISRFPPGWPLILSIAFFVHIPPFLINVVLGILSTLVLFRMASRIYDERIAMWSSITMLFSSFFIFNSSTYFSHMASLLEGLLFVYFSYRYVQTGKPLYALGAGIFLGMLLMTRQLNAIIFLLPIVAWLFYELRWRAVLPLVLIAVGAIPFAGLFLWYNYSITGDPFVPVTMWTNADEALGFVKGHTPAKGLKFTFKRLAMFIYWASPTLLILYLVFLVLRLKDYRKIWLHPEDYLFVLLIVGYFFYYHSGGNQYGPRFYLEAFPFVVAFVVAKVMQTNYRWARVLLFAGIAFNLVRIPFIAYREHQVVEERQDVYAQVENKNIKDAIVFISSGTGIIRPMPVEDLNRNDRYYRNDVIYARDLGERNVELMRFYKDKDFYLYRRQEDVVEGELIPIPPPDDLTHGFTKRE
jgi:hypothetical protein